MDAAVERFVAIDGCRLYLESSSGLGPAIALYESAGFVHESPPELSDYARADVYMVYREKVTRKQEQAYFPGKKLISSPADNLLGTLQGRHFAPPKKTSKKVLTGFYSPV